MVDLRRLKPTDYDKINEIWERCHKGKYGVPARKFVITEAITENGRITGYGIVRFFAEAMLYLDKDLTTYEQAKSFKALMEQAIIDCRSYDLDQLNVSIEDEDFRDILKRHYNFSERAPVLFLDLEENRG
jgi:hypothetical protein